MLRIRSKKVYIDEKFVPAVIEIDNGKIRGIMDYDDEYDKDYGDMKIYPGFVDIHCHGYQLFDFSNADEEKFVKWIKDLPKEGCTGFLPSSSTGSEEKILKAMKLFRKYIENPIKGAHVLGNNTEGPFISFDKAGAQNKYEIMMCKSETIEKWQEVSGGNILYNTIAPEMDRDYAMTKWCAENGIVVAIGHTNATYETAMGAVDSGARSFTHTYNGMSQFDSRKPGVVGAAFDSDVYAELIADGVHTHPASARALAKIKGKDKLIIVTDSVSLKGAKPGVYDKNAATKVIVHEDGSIRLPDGRLSGSSNAMNKLLRNAVINMHIDEVTAVNAMSKNPCELLNIKGKGLIKEGYDADITILDDDYNVIMTYCLGEEML